MINCTLCNQTLTKCHFLDSLDDAEVSYLCNCEYAPHLICNKDNVEVWSILINNKTITLYSSKKNNETVLINRISNEDLLVINHFTPLPNSIEELCPIIDKLSKLILYK